MVINFHTLNEKTIGDVYPLPNIMEMLDQLGSAEYFSIFDLASEFYQISMYIDCLMHKKQRFPLCTALSIQSNVIRIKEHNRHILETHGLGIIRITKERYVRLS